MRSRPVRGRAALLALVGACAAATLTFTTAYAAGGGRPVASLKTVPIPTTNFSGYLQTDASGNVTPQAKAAAIALGKALFWDMQTGGDGKQACASCHFNAGADSRSRNQLNPGPASSLQVGDAAANYQLQAQDFPLHLLVDPTKRTSAVLRDSANVVGSQGLYHNTFVDIVPGSAADSGQPVPQNQAPDVFNVGGINTRRVTGKNTPSVINAVFNFRNFWDGRAQNIFNGVNPGGATDASAFVLRNNNGSLDHATVRIANAALASQSVGPPNNATEMSYDGRDWHKLGKKMLSMNALAKQFVDPTDSVLGPFSAAPANGLIDRSGNPLHYASLIQQAFDPLWWNSSSLVDGSGTPTVDPNLGPTNTYSQMEYNFSLFWGIAIQMYESTLVADNSRFDQFMEGNANALSALEKTGFNTFQGKGNCAKCHMGPELTDASVANQPFASTGTGNPVKGWHMIGVRPVSDDKIIGAGAAKTPGLRNVELTAPYLHNGGQLTLEQVVQFYGRGGDFGTQNVDLDSNLRPFNFSATDVTAVAAFLRSLTDERVRNQAAPFDHPSIDIPQGSDGSDAIVTPDGTSGQAKDAPMLHLNATGAKGGQPLTKFLN
ncbi:MAG TPA: cytochrome c peroxidase [Terriglobales bacterium]